MLLISSTTGSVYAQMGNNNFFGTNAGPGNYSSTGTTNTSPGQDYSKDLPEDSNPNAGLPGLNETTPSASASPNALSGEFTGDEKRMQRKYQDNINNAKNLIAKGTHMMESAHNNQHNPTYKKGRILKEIGEKSLAELTANNPFGKKIK